MFSRFRPRFRPGSDPVQVFGKVFRVFRVFTGVQPVEPDRASGSGDGSEGAQRVSKHEPRIIYVQEIKKVTTKRCEKGNKTLTNIFTGDPQKKTQKVHRKYLKRNLKENPQRKILPVQVVFRVFRVFKMCSGCSSRGDLGEALNRGRVNRFRPGLRPVQERFSGSCSGC